MLSLIHIYNGVVNLVVQPTHLMHGAEYDELVEAVEKYQDQFGSVTVAEPLLGEVGADAVSYTHLDVYKRQAQGSLHHFSHSFFSPS